MSEQTFVDETGTVEVEFTGTEVDAVRVSNLWKNRMGAEELAATITRLIRMGLPPLPEPARAELRAVSLPRAAVAGYLAENRAGRAATRRYLERLRAGQVTRPEARRVSVENHVEVVARGGRFSELLLHAPWAQEATVQTICDSIMEALAQLPLVEDVEPDPDLTEARARYAAARRYLVEK